MHTDRELLELAAKAAGFDHVSQHADGLWYVHDQTCEKADLWNPLDNDGDSLRLAVKLGMEVYVDTHPDGCSCSEAQSYAHPDAPRSVVNHDVLDVEAATRRAIVVAAAAIGQIAT